MTSENMNESIELQRQRDPSPKLWKEILLRHDPEFVWLRFMPLNGSYLVVMIPTSRLSQMLENGIRASVASAISHALRNDHIANGRIVPGVLYLEPDLSSAYICPGNGPKRVEIMTSFLEREGAAASICARSRLANLTGRLQTEYRLAVLLGFEIEVVFMRPVHAANSQDFMFEKVGSHSWCNINSDDWSILQMIEEIVRSLSLVNAAVEKFHTESAPGQWEFVLSPRTPVEAVDMLLRARETINIVAQQNGLRATLHPRPYPEYAGTGAHTHISATPLNNAADLKRVESFFAGILFHLPSILAFAMPLDISYNRVATGIWSGGEYVCWGWENRETPLRRITETRFEFKLMCGTANPYITLCAILVGGIDGLENKLPLVAGDCQGEAANLSTEELSRLQITTKLPTSIDESLEKLQSDEALVRGLGMPFVSAYVSITKEWNEVLRKMETRERENWIISHY